MMSARSSYFPSDISSATSIKSLKTSTTKVNVFFMNFNKIEHENRLKYRQKC